jgi:hypothetical protein
MLSTSLSLQLYTRDLSGSLARTASQPTVKADAAYYKATIGKVRTVDDLVGNYRLFSYAMKAYGLEDMIYAKGFMKKVLESDLSNTKSFANKLSDSRYRDFAAAFNFGTDGKIKSAGDLQSSEQEDDLVGLYAAHNARASDAVTAETAYFGQAIAGVRSVDGLLSDSRLVSFVETAFTLDPATSPYDLRAALVSDVSDPASFANRHAAQGYDKLAAAFQFRADGSLAAGSTAQTSAALAATKEAYARAANGGVNSAAEGLDTAYYTGGIGAITSVDALMADRRLLGYALVSVGLDPAYQADSTLRSVLTSDPADPASFANQQADGAYRALARAFNFQADGTLASGTNAQTAAQTDATVAGHKANYAKPDDFETTHYEIITSGLSRVDDVLSDDRVYAYLLKAFDIDASTLTHAAGRLGLQPDPANPDGLGKAVLKAALTSDLADPSSFVDANGDPKLVGLVRHFNAAKDGSAAAPRIAQSQPSITLLAKAYVAAVGTDKAKLAAAKGEATYYATAVMKVASVDDLLKDQRLVAFILKANDLTARDAPAATLRAILTSDPGDPKSFANTAKDTRYRAIAAAFNFTATGAIAAPAAVAVQTRQQLQATGDLYLHQTLEGQAGDTNKACAWRSTSSARPPRSPAAMTCWRTRPCCRSFRRLSACRPRRAPPISTRRPS